CAVGRVVTLPAVEITAQATALLVLVMLSAARTMAGNPLCLRGRRDSPRSPGASAAETVSFASSRRKAPGRRGGGVAWESLGESRAVRFALWREGVELCEMPTRNFSPQIILTVLSVVKARFNLYLLHS
ncbi:hypothetical protein H1C71_012878, partial [Ictidomys tridecemlineatus]